jgi:predicted DsbA family dithiol-disulfide isomerase
MYTAGAAQVSPFTQADHLRQRTRRLGIHSVPSIVVDGRYLIQGGQPPEAFERALREIAVERSAA